MPGKAAAHTRNGSGVKENTAHTLLISDSEASSFRHPPLLSANVVSTRAVNNTSEF